MGNTFKAEQNSIHLIVEYVSDALSKSDINKNLAYEYQLLVEEIVIKLVENASQGAEIYVNVYKKLGSMGIKINCAGKAIALHQEDEFDFGGKIIEEFGDYLKQDYSAGVNHIIFSSSTTESNSFILNSGIAVIASIIIGVTINFICDAEKVLWINTNLISPIVDIFTKCLQTVATPVAFFSLAAFIVTLKLTIENNRKLIFIAIRYASTSIIALAIGTVIWKIYSCLGIYFDLNLSRSKTDNFFGDTIGEFLNQSVLGNFIDPFLNSNPIPMLVMGVLLGIAAGNLFGVYGNSARNGILTFNGLFCKMMDLIYNAIPFFLFFALLRGWLTSGIDHGISLLVTLATFIPGFILLMVLYFVELLVNGISPIKFLKDYKEVLIENLKIGSNIQAMPYNKRMISRITKMPRDVLDKGLQLGAMMNMDGNCIVVSMGIIGMIYSLNIELSIIQIALMALIILLLSVGAPNQPGSFLLGIAVLMSFVGISSTFSGDFLIIEAIFGKVYSCMNATGDIVMMVIEDKRIKDAEAKANKAKKIEEL